MNFIFLDMGLIALKMFEYSNFLSYNLKQRRHEHIAEMLGLYAKHSGFITSGAENKPGCLRSMAAYLTNEYWLHRSKSDGSDKNPA